MGSNERWEAFARGRRAKMLLLAFTNLTEPTTRGFSRSAFLLGQILSGTPLTCPSPGAGA